MLNIMIHLAKWSELDKTRIISCILMVDSDSIPYYFSQSLPAMVVDFEFDYYLRCCHVFDSC